MFLPVQSVGRRSESTAVPTVGRQLPWGSTLPFDAFFGRRSFPEGRAWKRRPSIPRGSHVERKTAKSTWRNCQRHLLVMRYFDCARSVP